MQGTLEVITELKGPALYAALWPSSLTSPYPILFNRSLDVRPPEKGMLQGQAAL
jgi:hypothetical protein